jgi:hypothetical protein
MATIQSVINDLEVLLASLKLKLNEEMGIAIPVAEPVVVYATPVEDLIPVVKVKTDMDWTQLPDDILTYIGKFIDFKKRDAKKRYKTYLRIYHSIRDSSIENRWKEYAKSITKNAIVLNEAGKRLFDKKTITIKGERNRWEQSIKGKYKSKLEKMEKRYNQKYWRGIAPFRGMSGKFFKFFLPNRYWCWLPTDWDEEERVRRTFAGPVNAVGGRYIY